MSLYFLFIYHRFQFGFSKKRLAILLTSASASASAPALVSHLSQVLCINSLFCQNHYRYCFETTLIYHHNLHQQPRVHNSVKVFVRIMALFRLRTLIKFYITISFLFKTIRDIAIKLTTLVDHHYLHQQTREHNSVKVCVRIMARFYLECWLSFPYHFTFFRFRILVQYFVYNPTFFRNIRDKAYTLTILINHHYLHQQARVHNSVKVFERIMALFRL